MTNETRQKRTRLLEAGVREIARLTGYSPCYVCIVRQGQRKARPLRAKMLEMGLKFKEVR